MVRFRRACATIGGSVAICVRTGCLVDDAAHPDRYVSVHGLRVFAGDYSEDGLTRIHQVTCPTSDSIRFPNSRSVSSKS